MLTIAPETSALLLIDLQNGILRMPVAPRSSDQVLALAKEMASQFRAAGALVVPVRVAFAANYADAPSSLVDQAVQRPVGGFPDEWGTLADGLAAPGDLLITKRQWGAFYGTELDLQLRRRGITTIVLGGISTNFGVELTARQAWELGYHVVIVEDLCAGPSAELHAIAIQSIFPRIARVRTSDQIRVAAA